MPKVNRSDKVIPRFVNRGPAGLLRKLTSKDTTKDGRGVPHVPEVEYDKAKKDNIKLEIKTVPIDSLTPDPENARLHPERNMDAIRQSLALYGQLKPLVVREEGMIVVAGNGTLQAAKDLGWKEIAISIIPLSHVEAVGYGLADNRTSELARWNGEVLARLSKYIAEQEAVAVGWSSDELEVLRTAADQWVPPAIEEGDSHPVSPPTRVLKFTQEQYEILDRVIDSLKRRETQMNGKIKDWSDEECLIYILRDWIGDEPSREEAS